MIINIQNYYFNEGVYGQVFYLKENCDKTAIKVFFKRKNKTKGYIKNTFLSEVAAYKILSSNLKLNKYIPKFYNTLKIEKIIDRDGKDISENYYLDFAFKMEFIEGTFTKYSAGYSACEILNKFVESGVKYVKDCSVIVDDNNQPIKIIDFATHEVPEQ